ncbi:chromosome transmission fidelity protein 8 homolog [Pollicipes pollicipes]|uniref:chromosome transmission fidelity protein 8 homolog n=1 Tax=Pollicipes pollicipes TaxID=41117 RepID=UPI0018858C4E|nr:chromosome transmission fidelity protein 8 homolog [Pollicipes pollicipes]
MIVRAEAGGPAAPPSWALIELQGDLESRSGSSLAGQLIGDLHFTRQGAPVLIVGHHILWGKVATLEKPLLVMEKGEAATREISVDAMETEDAGAGAECRYHVRAVVRKKILFRSRPKPIIANVPKKL